MDTVVGRPKVDPDPSLLVFTPLCDPFLLSVGRNYDLLLLNRI